MNFQIKTIPNLPSISFIGPDLDFGALPALIYFALSSEESLTKDPYNQPVQFLQGMSIRVFSFTLPFHGPLFDNNHAMQNWADELSKNPEFISDFIKKCSDDIDLLIKKKIIDPQAIGVAGLSRGGFMATYLAAENKHIKTILGFAPLTSLDFLHEFKSHFDYQPFNLKNLNDKLIHKHLRFYIGNCDTRVGTEKCFQFVHGLAETAHEHKVRSPKAELIMSPSVGHKGHGTLPHIFQDGINWLLASLTKIEP